MSATSTQTELRAARHRAMISIGINLSLAVGKGVAGAASGSTALLGDAIHSATDVLASTAAFVGLWVAGREHPSFPYGLYKAETVATLVTSIAILIAAYEIGRQALFGTHHLPDIHIALPVACISFVVTLLFGIVQLRAGKRLNSPALIADAQDYIADAQSTGIVLLSLVAGSFGYKVDKWAAAIVAIFVFRAGISLLINALKDLLDASIDRETERDIIRMVESHPRITRVKQCLSRTAGGRFIVDIDVIMRTPSHKIADQVSDRLEETIPNKFPRVVIARIRPHYQADTIFHRLMPVTGPDGGLAGHFAGAQWFLRELVDTESKKTLRRDFLQNPHWQVKKKKGLLVGQWLLSLKPDEIIISGSHSGTAITLLQEAGIDVKKLNPKSKQQLHGSPSFSDTDSHG